MRVRETLKKCLVTVAAGGLASLASFAALPSNTETAVANGDTRTLHLYHTHTGESIDATFRVGGQYDPEVLRQLNHFLRDWRNNDEISMDPRLFDTLWEVYRTAGATDPIQIYSAYRSPETNAMLRRRSRAVAEHSQHMLGKAMDTTIPGFPMHRIREIGMKLQRGGVGWYPSANFVHLDVGGVRSWPRMSYDQLASLFPDGKTVHIASNGQTLPGYEAARQEIAMHGGVDVPPAQESQGFFAWLFGGGSTSGAAREDEEDRRATAVASAAPPPVAQPAPVPVQQEQPVPADLREAQPASAMAYASSPSVAPQPVATAETAAPASQVASLGPDATQQPADTEDAVMPLPPRRPADLVADAEIPLPPSRPDELSPIQSATIRFSDARTASLPSDQIAGLITSTASGLPAMRKSRLPAIITQGGGSSGRLPGQALGFAAVEGAVPEPVARPASLGRPVAPRGGVTVIRATRKPLAALDLRPSQPAFADAAPVSGGLVGPKVTGLRSAAHAMLANAAL